MRAGGCQAWMHRSRLAERATAEGNIPRRVGSKKVRLAGYRCIWGNHSITPLSRWALVGRSARSIRGAANGKYPPGIPFGHLLFPKRDRQNHSFQFWEHLFAAVALPHANVPKILRFYCVQNAVLRVAGKRYSQK